MKILGIIPSRYASSRLPGKPLAEIAGKPMIQHVYERALKSARLSKVVVATDHQDIYACIEQIGGEVRLTSSSHPSGTDRCGEILTHYPGFDYVINIQGDEPFVDPEQLDTLAQLLDGKVQLATLVKKMTDPRQLTRDSIIKVVLDSRYRALYFSRQPVPFQRNRPPDQWLAHHTYYKHIGIYAYRADILTEIIDLPPSGLEQAESLEQLRWLENGYTIFTALTDRESISIDTPDDLERARELIDLRS